MATAAAAKRILTPSRTLRRPEAAPLVVTVQHAEPHSAKQDIVMRAHSIAHVDEIWVACGTKFGKTLGASASITTGAMATPDSLWRWVAPITMQARIGFKYARKILPPAPYSSHNLTRNMLSLPGQATDLQYFHGQDAESLEGEAVHGYVLDECAKLSEDVYNAAKTTTTVTRGKFLCISTPNGKNWFYRKCMQAKAEMEWAYAKGRPPRKLFITAPTSTNSKVLRSVIAAARRDLPERLYRQYYLAEFVDDSGVFSYMAEAFGHALDFSVAPGWYADVVEGSRIFVGADWAKTKDYTVFYALNEAGRCIGYQRFNRRPYPDQVAALWEFCAELRRRCAAETVATMVQHDATGVGSAIADIIDITKPDNIDVEGIVWGSFNKEVAVNGLILSLEQRKLWLHPWEFLRSEASTFEVVTSLSGRPRFAATSGCHDDTIMALVLANALFREHANGSTDIIVVDTIESLMSRVHYGGGNLFQDFVD